MKKGDRVLVKATVRTGYARISNNEDVIYEPRGGGKRILRYPHTDVIGIIIGYSWRATGHYSPRVDDNPPFLSEDKRHKVWLVESLRGGDERYIEPLVCLEADLEIIE